MAQAKEQRDEVPSSNESAHPASAEGVAWKGPRTVVVQKNTQGFGFTLRHFIVYPPESAFHSSLKDEENGNGKANQRGRLEPMDTIFVKSVREKGPAHQAGLCTGDRLVKVNGENVLGKTYTQVIALIQSSASVLELSIMPKDEDVLQLAYSQDAYLKGNEPYTGVAENLPEPPPICYSRSKPTPAAAAQTLGPPDNLNCRPSEGHAAEDGPGDAGRRSDGPGRGAPGHHRARSSSSAGIAVSPLDFHFANHNAAIASASLPHPRKNGQARNRLCHQALADWYHSQAAGGAGLAATHRQHGGSQERLPEAGHAAWPHSASQETLLHHYGGGAGANWATAWGPPSGRSCSENLLAAYAGHEQGYGCSLESLGQAALVSTRYGKQVWPQQGGPAGRAEERPGPAQERGAVSPAAPQAGQGSGLTRKQADLHPQMTAQPRRLPARAADDQTVGYCSYSPSFCRKAGHLMQQAHSFRDASYAHAHLGWTPTPKASPSDSAPSLALEASPLPPSSVTEDSVKTSSGGERELEGGVDPAPHAQEVLLRQKPPSGRPTHVARHLPEPAVASAPAARAEDAHPQSLPLEHNSLASIPFIGNMKNSRRSSYLLAVTTERSKSCDEGLNVFREEGRVLSRLPKRVKSFFTDGSLESLRAAEDARSKRHSTSELGSITLTDVRKEGWLHYKQILTEKGKKVGGAMRPWKRAFSVLRTHSLFLYKDKREAVLHGAGTLGRGSGSGQGEDEQPISIRGCLIDIAYSETKRKHALRLTTQDFCEYLLQAEDRDDMLSWIRVIRENSKTDSEELGFSRQALINKKLNDYRKQSPTGNKPDTSPRLHRIVQPFLLSRTDSAPGANRALRTDGKEASSAPKAPWSINIMKKGKKAGPKAFGVRLEDCPPGANNKFVPLIVEICCSLVEGIGLEYTGIYRVPGNNAMVCTLQEQLNKGMDINTTEERWQDLNVISSLLKSFFRKLPEPLFTDDKYNDFIEANRLEDAGDRLKTMRKLVHDLPDHHYHTLKFLVGHLKRVADHAEKNKMEPRNLALVFGPTLVRTSEDNMTAMVTHMPDRYKIVETLIQHYDWFFSEEADKDEKTPEDQQDEQRVPNIDHLLSNIGRTAPLGEASDSTISDSAKSKQGSVSSKKDVSAKDFLPLSIISAVTRKRKKHQNACPTDSSSDEDSEHEPVKSSNYGGLSESAGAEVDEGGGEREAERGSQAEKVHGKGGGAEGGTGSEEEAKQQVGEKGSWACQQEDGSARAGVDAGPRQSSAGRPASPTCDGTTFAHRLGQANPVARKKLRGERARPRSLHAERGRLGEELARVKASLVRGQERLRQAMSPSREPPLQQGWLGQVQANLLASANDLWRSGAQWRHASPETRRRRRDWRRHTVVGGVPTEG